MCFIFSNWFSFKLEIIQVFLIISCTPAESLTLQGVSSCIIQELQVHNNKEKMEL